MEVRGNAYGLNDSDKGWGDLNENDPYKFMFEYCLVHVWSCWWNCFGKDYGGVALLEEVLSLGMSFEVSKVYARPSLSL